VMLMQPADAPAIVVAPPLVSGHAGLQDRLAAAMAAGTSVGRCIAMIEQELADSNLLAPPGAVAAAAEVSEVAQGGAAS
jgi:hypothetical protein